MPFGCTKSSATMRSAEALGAFAKALREHGGDPSQIEAMSSVEEGLKATLRLVIDPALENVTGEYFDGLRPAKANAQACLHPESRRPARCQAGQN